MLRSPVQIPVLEEAGRAHQINLLPFTLSDVSQLHSAFTKQAFSHRQSNLSSEEGEKQFPLPILLNTHLFLNGFIMSPFTVRNVQSSSSTKKFAVTELFFQSKAPASPPGSLPAGTPGRAGGDLGSRGWREGGSGLKLDGL